jgi:hypothetical protein
LDADQGSNVVEDLCSDGVGVPRAVGAASAAIRVRRSREQTAGAAVGLTRGYQSLPL